ncbi:alpha/beta-hydrolase [Trametes meyenii]|nr:alpha/beta-hydrolase [Trametes meyenii]
MSSTYPTLADLAKGTAATAAGISTIGFGLLFFGQRYLLYPSGFPSGSRTEVPVPTDFSIPYQDLPLVTPDKVTLRCYLLTQRKELPFDDAKSIESSETETDEEFASRRPTIIMFHGNGGNVGHRIPLAKVFYVAMRCNVLMLSYRGYGHSNGHPSEKGIRIDAQCALDYVLAHPYLSKTPVVLYGQSLGGAVAIDLASRNPHIIRGLVVENTFTSIPRLVPTAVPILGPFTFLCHQKWDSASKIPLIPAETPILLLSGERDQVIPEEHMADLWYLVKRRKPRARPTGQDQDEGLPRSGARLSRVYQFHNGTHNDTCVQRGYWEAVSEFIEDVESLQSPLKSSEGTTA